MFGLLEQNKIEKKRVLKNHFLFLRKRKLQRPKKEKGKGKQGH